MRSGLVILVVSAIGALDAITGFSSHDESEVTYKVAAYSGLAGWNSGMSPSGPFWQWGGGGSGNGWSYTKLGGTNGENGILYADWQNGKDVVVGKQLRTAIVFYVTAQEVSHTLTEREAHGILSLERADGYTPDLSEVKYEWK